MKEVRDPNIKNRTYYYFDDMIDIKKFDIRVKLTKN